MDSMNDAAKKKSLGRRKIEIKKISNINSRQVTFSKRQMGLFRKASELCVLTGTEVALIVQSPGNHVYSFGHPNVKSVTNRYLHQGSATAAAQDMTWREKSAIYNDSMNKKDYAVVKKRELDARRNSANVKPEGNFWWNEAVENLGVKELEQHLAALEELKMNVSIKADQLKSAASVWSTVANNIGPKASNYLHYFCSNGDDGLGGI